MKQSWKTRLLSCCLSAIVLFELLPPGAWAAGEQDTPTDSPAVLDPEQTQSGTADDQSEPLHILGEVEALRTESQKHFRLSDGSFAAVAYDSPVHYADSDGQWQDIDNTLTLNQGAYVAENGLESKAYAATLNQGEPLFTASYGDCSISVSPVDLNSILSPGSGDAVVQNQPADDPSAAGEAGAPPEGAEAPSPTTPSQDGEEDLDAPAGLLNEPAEPEVPADAASEPADNEPSTDASEPPTAEPEPDEAPSAPPAAPDPAPQGEPNTEPEAGPTPASGIPAVVTNPSPEDSMRSWDFDGKARSLEEQLQPDKFYSAVQYEGVYPGVDLRYDNSGSQVKETILIHGPQNRYHYAFTLRVSGLHAAQEDERVVFYDAHETPVYEIPTPYMFDSEGNVSYEVHYGLWEMEPDCYVLEVDADADWIEAPGRAFPVSVDPTLVLFSGRGDSDIVSGFTRSGLPNEPSNGSNLYFGYGNGQYHGVPVGQMRCLFSFGRLPDIPANCTMASASLSLYVFGWSSVGMSQVHAQLHEVTENKPRDESYASWVRGITHKTMPNYEPEVLEYRTLSAGTNNRYVSWDLSRVVAKWYENLGNDSLSDEDKAHRVLAMDTAEAMTSSRCAQVAMHTYTGQYMPYLCVYYRNNVGVEDRFTYQTVSAARAGTGYIADYTGQLTLANTPVSIASNTLPFGLTHYFNSANRNTDFVSTAANGIHTANYTTMRSGAGWKLSIQESIVPLTVSTPSYSEQYYAYNDGDGSEHYFRKNTSAGQFEDDEGLGLHLEFSGSTITLKDQSNNYKEFYNGYLVKLGDANGNAVYLLYNGQSYAAGSTAWKPKSGQANQVTKVIQINDNGSAADVVKTLYTLSYSGGYLSSVTDAASRTTTYSYTSIGGAKRLTAIAFADGTKAQYAYDSDGNLSKAYDAEAQYGLSFTYRGFVGLKSIWKVSEFTAATLNGVAVTGNAWHCWVFSTNQKEYRFYGPDQTRDTVDDTVVRYTFDHTGRTVNVANLDSSKAQVLGVSASAYTTNQGTSKRNNRLTGAGAMGAAATNLLNNSGLERSNTSSYAWQMLASDPSTSKANVAFKSDVSSYTGVCVKPRTGGYLMKLYLSADLVSDTSRSPYVTEYQKAYLRAGVRYTLSAYVNTATVTRFGKDGGMSLYFATTGGGALASSQVVDYNTSKEVSGGWTRLEVSYTPSSTGWYRVGVTLRNAGAYAACDDLQLERQPTGDSGTGASTANLVQLGSFELWNESGADRSLDASYWSYDASKVCPGKDGAKQGYSLYAIGSVLEKRRASQTIAVNCSSDTTFILSGWGWANSVPDCAAPSEMTGDNQGNQRFFGLIAKVTYAGSGIAPEYQYIPFDELYTDWQYASGFVVPKQVGKTVASITISAAYDYNANIARFDDISLVQEPAQTYSYNADGKLESVRDASGSENTYKYQGADLKEFVSGGYGTYTYEYDGSHNRTKATNDGVSVSATYDEAGNATSTTLRKGSTGDYLKTEAQYTKDGNFVSQVTDANGLRQQTSYFPTGLLSSETTVLNQSKGETVTTNHTYLSNSDRASSAYIRNTVYLGYGYTKGSLSSVSRKAYRDGSVVWQRYAMTLDPWGNTKEIRVQGTGSTSDATPTMWNVGIRLAAYEYAGENGELERTTYGNGSSVAYRYDRFGRVTTASHYAAGGGLTQSVAYFYDGNGNVSRSLQLDAYGRVKGLYAYEYDSLGRMIRSRLEDGEKALLRTEHQYDTENRLTKQSYQIGADAFSESFTYNDKDGSLSDMTAANGDPLSYDYDGIKRLSSLQTPAYTKGYAYRTRSGSQSSAQVSLLRYMGLSKALSFGYTYNDSGNIATISRNGAAAGEFRYDSQGQLLGAYTMYDDNTYNYQYDTAGNLLQTSTWHVYSGGGKVTNTYSYANSSWKDLLTAFNGEKIAYEGQSYSPSTGAVTGTVKSGNPVSYYNGARWDLAWAQERNLASAAGTAGGWEYGLSFTYDQNGLRRSKTVAAAEVEATEPTEPSEPPTKPTDPPVKPTQPPTKPTDPPVKPTDPPTKPTNPGSGGGSGFVPDETIHSGFLPGDGEIPEPTIPTSPYSLRSSGITQEVHEYLYASGLLLRETVTTGGKTLILDFAYVGASPYTITCREQGKSPVTYYYILNLEGDVVALADRSGAIVAQYTYDPFGKPLTVEDGSNRPVESDPGHIANRNPLRYRGYYYDRETGLYYLQSRYYDPAICRFINADAYAATGISFIGCNMFAYCHNDPINFADFGGTNEWWIMAITHDWGLVHREVIKNIRTLNQGILTEVTVDWDKKGYGRMDVYDPDTHTVWELKTTGAGAAKASKQASGYVGSTLRSDSKQKVQGLGIVGRFTGSLSIPITLGSTSYAIEVTYETPQMGVILYSFEIKRTEKQPFYVKNYSLIKEQVRRTQAQAAGVAEGIASVGVAGALAFGGGGGVVIGGPNLGFGWGGQMVQQLR